MNIVFYLKNYFYSLFFLTHIHYCWLEFRVNKI